MIYRFLVTGGRDFQNPAMVRLALQAMPINATLVHGAARGADSLAAAQWEAWGGATEPFPADWDKHGKAAGPIRNQEMLQSGIDHLIAFPGGRGTADMVRRCERAGVPITFAAQIEPVAGA